MDLEAIGRRVTAATEGPWDAAKIAACLHTARTDVPALVARVRELEAENEKLRDTAAVAHYVTDHWREVTAGAGWAIASHPLSLVLAALNGETEPEKLGLEEEDRAALERARENGGGK